MAQDKIIVIIMEENNDIFLAGGDAVVCLVGKVKYELRVMSSNPRVTS